MGHMKYLSLIQAIILLHERNRLKQKSKYKNRDIQPFEVSRETIGLAYKLAHETLLKPLQNLSLSSSLLLLFIEEMVDKACAIQRINRADSCFTSEEIKNYTGWGSSQLKLHLR